MLTDDRKQAVKYLLGELAEAEQSLVEERSFQDTEFSELLSEVEDDLVDDYVRADLPAAERAHFERHYLSSPRRHEKMSSARSFQQVMSAMPRAVATEKVSSPAAPRRWWTMLFPRDPHPALSYSFAAAALIFLLSGLWLAFEVGRLRQDVEQLRAERETREQQATGLEELIAEGRRQGNELSTRLRREGEQLAQSESQKENLQKELARLKQQSKSPEVSTRAAPALASFVLSPGLRSSEAPSKLSIPRGVQTVRLRLNPNPGDEYPSYRVELQTADGEPVWSQNMLKSRSSGERIVIVNLPARRVRDGEYELTLKGVNRSGRAENIGYYYFSVLKR